MSFIMFIVIYVYILPVSLQIDSLAWSTISAGYGSCWLIQYKLPMFSCLFCVILHKLHHAGAILIPVGFYLL